MGNDEGELKVPSGEEAGNRSSMGVSAASVTDSASSSALDRRPLFAETNWGVIAASLVLGLLAWLTAFHPIWDIDIFWHIPAGRYILETLSLPETDIFSAVDPSRTWVTFQWLYEVINYWADSLGGLTLVRVLHATVFALAILIVTASVGRRSGLWAGLLAGSLVMVLFADRVRVRPDVFNLLFTAVLLQPLFARVISTGQKVTIGVCAALWANIHAGGVLLLPVLFGARAGGKLVWAVTARFSHETVDGKDAGPWKETLRQVQGDFAAFGVGVAAMLLMPGFLRGTIQAFSMLSPSEQFIPEWMSTWEFLGSHAYRVHEYVAGVSPIVAALTVGVVTIREVFKRTAGFGAFPFILVAIAVPCAVLGLNHVRFLWIGGLPIIALLWHLPYFGLAKGVAARYWNWAMGALAILLLALNLYYHTSQINAGPAAMVRQMSSDLEPETFPEGATEFLVKSGFQGRIVNHGPWGGFLLYHLWPEGRVFTDGRGNFSPIEVELLSTWDRATQRRFSIEAAYDRSPFEAVVHPDPFPFFDYERGDWLEVYRDSVGKIYLRVSSLSDDAREEKNWAGVVSHFASLGVALPEELRGEEEVERAERVIRRFWGARLLNSAEYSERLKQFEGIVAPGTPASGEKGIADGISSAQALGLARIYRDVGLYDEAFGLLQPLVNGQLTSDRGVSDLKPVAEALVCMTALGKFREGVVLCRTASLAVSRTSGELRAAWDKTDAALLQHLCTSLERR